MGIIQWMKDRFGYGDCSLKNLLWNVIWMMRFLTINIDATSNFRASIVHYTFDLSCLVCYIYCYVFCLFYNWIWVYPIHKDYTSIIIIISLSFASSIATMKLTYMFILRKLAMTCDVLMKVSQEIHIFRTRIMKVIDTYRIIDSTVDTDSRYGCNMLQRLKTVKRRSLIFWSTYCFTSFIYMTTPLIFLPGRNFPENSLQLYGLEPMIESPNYEIAYTVILLAGVTATSVPANVTVLLIVLVGYIEAHIVALTEEFKYLWSDTNVLLEEWYDMLPSDISIIDKTLNKKQRDEKCNQLVQDRLNSLVSRHGEFVVLLKTICKLFEGVIAAEFLLTMIALCAVLLGGLQDTYLQIPYTIIQLVVDSLVGQRLLDAGSLFELSVYNCGWENFNPSNVKTVQLVLQCSQKPLKLTAGGITTLCFESFMSITKSVYSAYATLSGRDF